MVSVPLLDLERLPRKQPASSLQEVGRASGIGSPGPCCCDIDFREMTAAAQDADLPARKFDRPLAGLSVTARVAFLMTEAGCGPGAQTSLNSRVYATSLQN